ncbi:MAG: ECF transporter S component [Oscillospiraceae bacterium]|jgi:riboflavin transporter FmnP|nr:ECF transporter S component [Oscillospiraceae bacterium]
MRAQTISINSLLAAISLLLAMFGRVLAVPFVPFLKLDISDAPAFVAALLFGIPSGLTILVVVSFLRLLLFSIAGWPGFFIRMLSFITIIFLGIYRKKQKHIIFYVAMGTLIYILVKTPVSYMFWTLLHLMDPNALKRSIFTIIIPFNLIKNIINCVLATHFSKPIKKILKIN